MTWTSPPAVRDPSAQESAADAGPCQGCGACCAYSRDWPRFTTEDDADIDRLPLALIAEDGCGMRWDGDRCAALSGEVGLWTACTVYEDRPEVCRACQPGDDACAMARRRYGLSELPAAW